MQLKREAFVVGLDDLQYLFLGGRGQLLRRQPRLDLGVEVGGDGADVHQGVGQTDGGVLILFHARSFFRLLRKIIQIEVI